MDAKLLQKIEELTLLLIEQGKQITELQMQIKAVKSSSQKSMIYKRESLIYYELINLPTL
jgi:hypothetical protein